MPPTFGYGGFFQNSFQGGGGGGPRKTSILAGEWCLPLFLIANKMLNGFISSNFIQNLFQKWIQKCLELKKAILCSGLPIPLPIPPQFMIAIQIAKGIICIL